MLDIKLRFHNKPALQYGPFDSKNDNMCVCVHKAYCAQQKLTRYEMDLLSPESIDK